MNNEKKGKCMKKLLMIIGGLCAISAYSGDTERLDELERICAFVPSDDLRRPEIRPMPHDIIAKYHITTNQLIADLKSIAMKYNHDEVDERERRIRASAVSGLGRYCTTNELLYLSAIMTNSNDYAQSNALGASISILKHSPELISLARGIVTNTTVYSEGLRGWTYSLLLGMCTEGKSDMYIADSAQHERIASFFLERAAVEQDDTLFVDRCAYTLNPWYRHSQQRRDNLARLRPLGLTGNYAEAYDARQRDAAQED